MAPCLFMGILLPVVKVAVQVIVIHVDDPALYLLIHGIFVVFINVAPSLEIRVKL